MGATADKYNKINGLLTPPSKRQRAVYIREELVGLARLARESELGMLEYLIAMAVEEAHTASKASK